MDLRKVLLKNILSESCLNNSNLSAYESAAEDSDSSIYYSFVNDSQKSNEFSESDSENDQSNNSENDKENTIIVCEEPLRTALELQDKISPENTFKNLSSNDHSDEESPEAVDIQNDDSNAVIDIAVGTATNAANVVEIADQTQKSQKIPEIVITEPPQCLSPRGEKRSEVVIEIDDEIEPSGQVIPEIVVTEPQSPRTQSEDVIEDVIIQERFIESDVILNLDPPQEAIIQERNDSPLTMMEISDEDPNENLVNPFIVAEEANADPVPAKRSKRRSSILQVPSKTAFFSPVIRRSLERKAKATAASRRTLYGSNKILHADAKTPSKLPKPMPKPRLQNCAVAGCNQSFPTLKALQDHQRTHKPSTSKSKFDCRFCDKKFQLEVALFTHQTEKCTKIPVLEKRKIMAKSDKKESERRRTTFFTTPFPRMKSPRRTPNQLNKSGVKITPKRSLKCHICQAVVPDAISMANHILAHKYNKDTTA